MVTGSSWPVEVARDPGVGDAGDRRFGVLVSGGGSPAVRRGAFAVKWGKAQFGGCHAFADP